MYQSFLAIRNIFHKKILASSLSWILAIGWINPQCQEVKSEVPDAAMPVISKVALLSIHVSSVELHDSVYHLLTKQFGLPVDYYPLSYAGRRYAAVHVGNLYLEPCGPFTTFTYNSKNFKAIFFGLNCESDRSVSSVAEELANRKIEIIKGKAIQVTDSSLTKPNIYINIVSDSKTNYGREDSLRSILLKNTRDALGIERVKEIRVGYKDDKGLDLWKELIKSSELSGDGVWKLKDGPSVRFVKSSLREVNSIVIKVKSLKKAQSYLTNINLPFNVLKDETSIEKSKTFGLSIFLTEK